MIQRIRCKADLDIFPRMLPELSRHSAQVDESLVRVVQRYNINDGSRCGLRDCSATHKKGAIFELRDKSVMRLGHVCGESHFQEKHRRMLADFEEQVQRRADWDVMHSVFANRESF